MKIIFRFVDFIKWWWNKQDTVEKIFLCFITFWVIPTIFLIAFFGILGLVVSMSILIALFCILLFINVLSVIKKNWLTFNEECPPEDVRIMNRLRGE